MLELGGKQIIEKVTGKQLLDDIDLVFDWQDPEESINFEYGNFLMTTDKALSKEIYLDEKYMQRLVMDAADAKVNIFSHELQCLYSFFELLVKDTDFPQRL